MKGRMVPDLFDLPFALLKQYYQDKGRWHNAALTDVSDCSFMQCITGGPQ